jgi:hypothetical protein
MALDSKAVFEARIKELGLQDVASAIVGEGWTTFGAFAFSCSYTPGNVDDSSFVSDVIQPVLGVDHQRLRPQLKRLFFEAHTMAIMDVQRRATPSDDVEKPKKLPVPEKVSRMRALKNRLVGLSIEGETEPSYALIDRFNSMFEDGSLKFVQWDELTRRDEEIKSVKKSTYFQTDKDGTLKVCTETTEDAADVGSDLKLKAALQRRGLAMEAAGLLTFEAHEKYTTWLFRAYTKPARAGYHPVSLTQIHSTDQEVFVKLAMATEKGLGRNLDNSLALDPLIKEVMADVDVSSLLVPFQKSAGGFQSNDGHQGTKRPHENHKDQQKKGGKRTSEKGKGKDNNKGKGKGSKAQHSSRGRKFPGPGQDLFAIDNMVSVHNGRRICFAYNLQGCDSSVKGGNECDKGLHVCSRKGCGGNHPQSYERCPKR